MRGIRDFNHCHAAFDIQLRLPQIFVFGAGFGVIYRLVIREKHRDQTSIGCALHIVLAA